MKINRTLGIACFSILFIQTTFYGQTVEQKAKSAAEFICECTKTALSNNGVNTSKLKEIYNSYQSSGFLLNKYNADAKKINSQLNAGYTAIETEIYTCRNQFRQKFKNDLSNKEFLSKMSEIINNNAFTNGPKLIEKLTN